MSTPPPQGQNPHDQQPPSGNPYGQQSGSPHGQQQGQPGPPPGQGATPFGLPGTPPVGGMHDGSPGVPASQGSKAKKLLRFGIPVMVLAIALGSYLFGGSDAEKVNAGDCIAVEGFSEVEVKQVDCGSSDATHKVLKKVEDDTSQAACEGVEGLSEQIYTKESSKDFSLCLSRV